MEHYFLLSIFFGLFPTVIGNEPEITHDWRRSMFPLNDVSYYYHYYDDMFIICRLPNKQQCYPKSHMELYFDGTTEILGREECESFMKTGRVRFEMPLKDKRIVNKLRCKYVNGTMEYKSKTLVLPYMHCPMGSLDCNNSDCPSAKGPERKYCLWTPNGTKQCQQKFDPSWCHDANEDPTSKYIRYCPVDRVGTCASMLENSSAFWYKTEASKSCLPISSPPLSYKGKPLVHGEPFIVDPECNWFELDCGEKSPFYGVRVGMDTADHECTGQFHTLLFPKKDRAIDVLTVVAGNAVIDVIPISLEWVKLSVANQKHENRLECTLYSRDISLDKHGQLKFTHWWTKKNDNKTRIQVTHELGAREYSLSLEYDVTFRWYLTMPDESGAEYQCHIEIKYKTCTPYYEIIYPTISSNIVRAESRVTWKDPNARTYGPPYAKGKTDKTGGPSSGARKGLHWEVAFEVIGFVIAALYH